MALRLFEHPLSPFARKVKLVLYEKGIPFERVPIDPLEPADDRDYQEFVLASPRHEVPCLVDGALRVFESRVIADYLEERWPDPALLPAAPAERARVRMIEEVCDTQLDAIVWGLMEIHVFGRGRSGEAPEIEAAARRGLARIWSRLERELEGRAWLSGEAFGRADVAALPHMGGPPLFGIPLPAEFPRLDAWLVRCASRPGVKREAAEASAAAGVLLARRHASDLSRFPRTYRNHRLEWMLRSGGLKVVLDGLAEGTIRFVEEF